MNPDLEAIRKRDELAYEDPSALLTPQIDRRVLLDVLAVRDQEIAAWHAECDKVGIPYDPEGLVRHHRANAGFAAALNAADRAVRDQQLEDARRIFKELLEAWDEERTYEATYYAFRAKKEAVRAFMAGLDVQEAEKP
jgi:hypothetical protein